MTEPDVASSDATNIQLTMRGEGDEYVLNGRKWWATGAGRPRCAIFIVMGKSAPGSPDRYHQQSMMLVPKATPGVRGIRGLSTMSYQANESHCEVHFDTVRVTATNLLGEAGS